MSHIRCNVMHPRLFLNKEEILELKKRAGDSSPNSMGITYKEIWDAIYFQARQYLPLAPPREIGRGTDAYGTAKEVANRLQIEAFVYLLTGEEDFLKKAKEDLLAVCRLPTWIVLSKVYTPQEEHPSADTAFTLMGVILVYDWLYDFLSEDERAEVRKSLIEKGVEPILKDDEFPHPERTPMRGAGGGRGGAWGHSYWSWIWTSFGLAALALRGEHPSAEDWVDLARNRVKEWLDVNYLEGGGDVQGANYGIESMTPVVFFAEALRENTFEDLFGHPYLKSFPTFILYNTIEGGTFVNFGDSWLEIYRYNVGLLRLASEYKDHYLQWIVKKAWAFPSGNFLSCSADTVFVFLWFDQTVEPIPPEELPSDHLFNGIGWAIFRTGWSRDDMLLAFKSGIRSRINTWDMKLKGERAYVFHEHEDQNSFIFFFRGSWLAFDPGPRYPNPEAISITEAHNSILVDEHGQERWYSNGSIRDFLDASFYGYVLGDASEAYHGLLKKFFRHIIFVKPLYFIVFDEIESDDPRMFTWLLHSLGELTVEDKTFFSRDGQNRLLIKFLLPGRFRHEIKTYPDYRGYPGGGPSLHPYLKLSPEEKASGTKFLVLLFPQRLLSTRWTPNQPETILIQNENLIGVKVWQENHVDIVVFNNKGKPAFLEEGNIKCDGNIWFIRIEEGKLAEYVVHNGTMLEIDGELYFKSDETASAVVEYSSGHVSGTAHLKNNTAIKIRFSKEPGKSVLDGKQEDLDYDEKSKMISIRLKKGEHSFAFLS